MFQTCNESITSVQGGIVASAGYDEIVCSTYAGMWFQTFCVCNKISFNFFERPCFLKLSNLFFCVCFVLTFMLTSFQHVDSNEEGI